MNHKNNLKNNKPSVFSLFSSACIIPFMLLVVAPLNFYFGNTNEIAFSLMDVALPLTGLFLSISVILFLLLYLVIHRAPKITSVTIGLLIGIATAVWIQSQLLVWNFGLLNGQKINWSSWKMQMWLEGSVWVVVIALMIIVSVKKHRKLESHILIGMYLAGFFSIAIGLISVTTNKSKNITDSEFQDIFSFHLKNNVLVIILDTYQSDYFEYIANNYPEEVSTLDGFTFYRNTACKFPSTKASLPSIITEAVYHNEKPFDAFVTESYCKFNLLDAYKKKSYSSYMVGLTGTSPNVLSMKKIVAKLGDNYVSPIFEYIDFALFRTVPTYFKSRIYNNGNWFFSFLQQKNYPPDNFGTDIRFMEIFEKKATIFMTKGEKGTFKILHFYIPHFPCVVNENLHFDPNLYGKDGYLKQTRGAIKLTSHILLTLKKIGIYDNTEIVIISDHGTTSIPQINQNIDQSDALSLIPSSVRSSSHALLLHKPVDSKGGIVTNDSPLEISDLACLLGLRDEDSISKNFLSAKSGDSVQRTFYYYDWDDSWESNYLPDITEYYINGHVFEKTSYLKGKFKYTSKGVIAAPLSRKNYQVGQPVLFSEGGESEVYILSGWSKQEPTHRWTNGSFAGLSFQLNNRPKRDMVLRLWGQGFSENGSNIFQKIKVEVNKEQVAYWEMRENNKYEAPIPLYLVPDGRINIVFEISNPGSSEDSRQLGLAVFKLVIDEK